MKRAVFLARALVLLVACAFAGEIAAQSFPSRPVKIIVPYPPGGQGDTITRIVGKKMAELLGQPIVVDNRAGAGATLGVDMAAKSPPDGYTVGLGDPGPLAVAPGLYPKLPYDPLRDLRPVSTVAMVTAALIVSPNMPAKTVRELIDLAKAKPGQLKYGAGYGTIANLAIELFKSMTGTNIMHVPYKGFAPTLTAMLAGEIDMAVGDYSSIAPQAKAGRLRILATTGSQRSGAAVHYPTIAEAGVDGYAVDFWFGFVVPAATSFDIVARLNEATVNTLNAPEVRRSFSERGYAPLGDTPEQFGAMIKAEIEKYARVIKDAHIRLE